MRNEPELDETRRVIEEVNDLILTMWRRHVRVLDPLTQSAPEPHTLLTGPPLARRVMPSPGGEVRRSAD